MRIWLHRTGGPHPARHARPTRRVRAELMPCISHSIQQQLRELAGYGQCRVTRHRNGSNGQAVLVM